MSYRIELTDAATPMLKGIDAAISDGTGVRQVIGRAAVNETRQYYFDHAPNKRGWPTTGFWAQCARGTNFEVVPEGVVLSVHQVGINQRLYGGTIRPVNAKALTIPISPDAYGKRAGEIPGLFLLRTQKGAYLVTHGDGSKEDSTLHFMYRLASSVTQKADSTAIPPKEKLEAAVMKAVSSYLARLTKRGGNN